MHAAHTTVDSSVCDNHAICYVVAPALGGTDSAAAVVKFTISIPRESCTNAKAKYRSSVVPPDPLVHFYQWSNAFAWKSATLLDCDVVKNSSEWRTSIKMPPPHIA